MTGGHTCFCVPTWVPWLHRPWPGAPPCLCWHSAAPLAEIQLSTTCRRFAAAVSRSVSSASEPLMPLFTSMLTFCYNSPNVAYCYMRNLDILNKNHFMIKIKTKYYLPRLFLVPFLRAVAISCSIFFSRKSDFFCSISSVSVSRWIASCGVGALSPVLPNSFPRRLISVLSYVVVQLSTFSTTSNVITVNTAKNNTNWELCITTK